jgi:hypothetical protein
MHPPYRRSEGGRGPLYIYGALSRPRQGRREWISRFSLVRVGRTVYGRPHLEADDESARLYSTDRESGVPP